MLRRTFLQSLPVAAAAVTASGAEVPVKLGFDTYSIRAFRWKAPQFLEFAASQKLDTIQFSSMEDYESYEPAYLQKVKDQAARLNISIDAGMGCICPTSKSFPKNGRPAREQILEGLRVAKGVGATAMRCFLGSSADRLTPGGIEPHMEATIQVFRSVRAGGAGPGSKDRAREPLGRYAGPRGQDHHRRVRQGLRRVVSRYGQPDVVRGRSVRHAGNPGAVRGHYARPRFGGFRSAERRGGAVGRTGRRLRRFREIRGAFPRIVPEILDAARNHHRTAAHGAAVPRRRILEGVFENARLGVRAICRTRQGRPSFYGSDGDRRRTGRTTRRSWRRP